MRQSAGNGTNRLVQPVAQTYPYITHGSYFAAVSADYFPPAAGSAGQFPQRLHSKCEHVYVHVDVYVDVCVFFVR